MEALIGLLEQTLPADARWAVKAEEAPAEPTELGTGAVAYGLRFDQLFKLVNGFAADDPGPGRAAGEAANVLLYEIDRGGVEQRAFRLAGRDDDPGLPNVHEGWAAHGTGTAPTEPDERGGAEGYAIAFWAGAGRYHLWQDGAWLGHAVRGPDTRWDAYAAVGVRITGDLDTPAHALDEIVRFDKRLRTHP